MAVLAKICGLNSPEAVEAALEGGAGYLGFVFYPPSPRAVTPEQAAALAQPVPPGIAKVGLFVDADDDTIRQAVRTVDLDMIQLHGKENARRVKAVRNTFFKTVIKAVKISTKADLSAAKPFEDIADWLMFDAKVERRGALPGGNGVAFDWSILKGAQVDCPWMLSGGLNPDNLVEAVRMTGAMAVDVSSGVEDSPGVKNPAKIKAFLDAARAAEML